MFLYFCWFLLSFQKDNISRFGIKDIPLYIELNLHTVHHIDMLSQCWSIQSELQYYLINMQLVLVII